MDLPIEETLYGHSNCSQRWWGHCQSSERKG